MKAGRRIRLSERSVKLRRKAGRYARYLAQQCVILPMKMGLFLLFVCSVLALVAVGLATVCLPLCSTGWDVAFLLLGMIGAFLTLLTISAGLHRAVDYVVMQPVGHFLNPLPPMHEVALPDSRILVRAATGDDATLLRPALAYGAGNAPELLLRAGRKPEN